MLWDILRDTEKLCRDFLWGIKTEKRIIHCLAWAMCCQSTASGGHGLDHKTTGHGFVEAWILMRFIWKKWSLLTGMHVNLICLLCAFEDETAEHGFYHCPTAWQAWRVQCSFSRGLLVIQSWDDIIKCLKKCLNNLVVKFQQAVVAYTLWETWKNRNAFAFQNATTASTTLACQCCVWSMPRTQIL